MTRHSKNATANAVYTFYEKKADSVKGLYGTQRVRVGKDSLQEFNCCCLTLQPCVDPVVTPEGYLYERQAIIEYLLHKKLDYKRTLKEYRLHKRIRKQKEQLNSKRMRFDPDTSISNMEGENAKHLPSFWVPSLTPAAEDDVMPKPQEDIFMCCPMTKNTLSHRDLLSVKFSLAKQLDRISASTLMNASEQGLYICPISGDSLSSSTEMAVLKPSGHVVTMEVVKRILSEDKICPLTGKLLNKDDIIRLQRVGTGYSAGGGDLKAEKHNPAMD
ncbi:hypothetical protein GJ496_006962 [Pomphorhynchus laevis]|nr:hypothetical protein GJ496_006962 [Pomphorhynchus laevis]